MKDITADGEFIYVYGNEGYAGVIVFGAGGADRLILFIFFICTQALWSNCKRISAEPPCFDIAADKRRNSRVAA